MQKTRSWQRLLLRSRWLPVLVVMVTLAVLGLTVILARLQLRATIREQLVHRDGLVLYAVTQTLLREEQQEDSLRLSLDDPGEQLNLILKASRLQGVMAVRLFDKTGKFVNGLPVHVQESHLGSNEVATLRQHQPVCHFHSQARFSELFLVEPSDDPGLVPIVEVNVPVHQGDGRELAGVAQFILEGQSLASEYAKLDTHLSRQAVAAFGGGGLVVVLALGWAFRRLARETAHLQTANQQLALAARMSAVGAVTAHLIHGLKNPLSGLQNYVSLRTAQGGSELAADLDQLSASTSRMQSLVNEVIAVLQEEQQGITYDLTHGELLDMIQDRVRPLARDARVEFVVAGKGEGLVGSRTANLVRLILVNLVQNAVQASEPGRQVVLQLESTESQTTWKVVDHGSGIPPRLAENLFTPHTTTKPGGCGIGLAISKQLADHLGANISLVSSSAQGSCFALSLPNSVLTNPEPLTETVAKN